MEEEEEEEGQNTACNACISCERKDRIIEILGSTFVSRLLSWILEEEEEEEGAEVTEVK